MTGQSQEPLKPIPGAPAGVTVLHSALQSLCSPHPPPVPLEMLGIGGQVGTQQWAGSGHAGWFPPEWAPQGSGQGEWNGWAPKPTAPRSTGLLPSPPAPDVPCDFWHPASWGVTTTDTRRVQQSQCRRERGALDSQGNHNAPTYTQRPYPAGGLKHLEVEGVPREGPPER